jgi:hypothetical protein
MSPTRRPRICLRLTSSDGLQLGPRHQTGESVHAVRAHVAESHWGRLHVEPLPVLVSFQSY